MLKDSNFASDTVTLSKERYMKDVNEIEERHQRELAAKDKEIEELKNEINKEQNNFIDKLKTTKLEDEDD